MAAVRCVRVQPIQSASGKSLLRVKMRLRDKAAIGCIPDIANLVER
jgi:hypothetical protein